MSAVRLRDYTAAKSPTTGPAAMGTESFWQKFSNALLIILVCCSAVFFLGWWLKGQLGKLWPLTQPATLVFTDPVSGTQVGPWVVQLQPDTRTVVWQNLPPQQETELWSGYGTYKLAAVQPLLALDHRSDQYQKATFSLITGVTIDAVVPWENLPKWQSNLKSETVAKFGSEPFRFLAKMYWQKIWSGNQNFSERVQNFKVWKLAWQWFLYTQQNQLRWNLAGQQNLLTPTAGEHANTCAIAVVNATGIQGLAREIGGALSSDGYSVVRVSAELDGAASTQVLLDPQNARECHDIAARAAGVLPLAIQPQENRDQTARYRAPIVMIVGTDSSK